MAEERERSIVENPVRVCWDLFNRIGRDYGRPVHINAAIAAGVHPGTASKQYNDWKNKQEEPAEEPPHHAEDK